MSGGFDVLAHHRERTRRAELRADGLERQRDRLESLLALSLQVGAANECGALDLLRVLEALVETLAEGEAA